MSIKKVVIVGAGPSGLVLGLLLAQRGIEVEVLEAGKTLDERPRAMMLGPVAQGVLQRARVLDRVSTHAQEMRSMTWRDKEGRILHNESTKDCLLLPVHLLCQILVDNLKDLSNATVSMGSRVVEVRQGMDEAAVYVETAHDTRSVHADLVIGCDGASSAVRQALLDDDGTIVDSPMEGESLLVANVRYDMSKYEWSDVQWIADPEDWGMIASISRQDDTWRVVANAGSMDGPLLPDDIRSRKVSNMLPGKPCARDFEIISSCHFRSETVCVSHMRKGRIVLAGDAAHHCNPIGGYGLTEGLADVDALTECLHRINSGLADLDILDEYSRTRLAVFRDITEPTTRQRIQHLSSPSPFRHAQVQPAAAPTTFVAELEGDYPHEMSRSSRM